MFVVKVTEKVQNSNWSLSGSLLCCWTFCNQTRHGNVSFRREKEKKKMSFDPRNPPGKNCLIHVCVFFCRINCLAAICLMQAWLMWNFITFQLRKLRERSSTSKKTRSPSKKKPAKGRWTVPSEVVNGYDTQHTHTCKSSIGFWRTVGHPQPHTQILGWILKDSELSTPSPPTGFWLFQFCNISFESHFPWLQSLLVCVCVCVCVLVLYLLTLEIVYQRDITMII